MASVTYRLPNELQMAELIYQQTKVRYLQEAANSKLSALEQELAARFAAQRNGKVFATKIWKFASNQASAGVRMRDSMGLTCVPSTDSVEGQDDFEDASPIFQWYRCNYTRDDDTTAHISKLEGMPGYATEGAADVGTLSPTFYWGVEKHADHDIVYMSDTMHPELGLVPWYEAVKTDGTVLPMYISSAFMSVVASDGLLRSQHGIPAYNQSYNSQVTDYPKKGTGYVGAGSEIDLLGYLFYIIKYAGKNSQTDFAGCTDFNVQVKCAVAETGVKRVLLASQGKLYAGCCVSVSSTELTAAPDRSNTACHTTVNRAKVLSIESVTVGDTSYTALNLDVDATFDTAADMYVTSMPAFCGETDRVIGHKDGSYMSNSSMTHPFRIKGIEYMGGQAHISSKDVYEKQGDYWLLYTAQKGVTHVKDARTGYTLAGKIPYNAGKDFWIGDMEFDPTTGNYYPNTIGSGSAVGTGDYIWEGGTGLKDGEKREGYMLGRLWPGSCAGFCSRNLGSVLGGADWHFGSRD